MKAALFMGIQGSGKTTFFLERFFQTRVRISLDLLRTRHREAQLLRCCLSLRQPLVIDNTNPTREDRARYIPTIRAEGFELTGYYFGSSLMQCLERNRSRCEGQRVPDVAVKSCHKRLQLPRLEEGFHQLIYVQLEDDGFSQEPWRP